MRFWGNGVCAWIGLHDRRTFWARSQLSPRNDSGNKAWPHPYRTRADVKNARELVGQSTPAWGNRVWWPEPPEGVLVEPFCCAGGLGPAGWLDVSCASTVLWEMFTLCRSHMYTWATALTSLFSAFFLWKCSVSIGIIIVTCVQFILATPAPSERSSDALRGSSLVWFSTNRRNNQRSGSKKAEDTWIHHWQKTVYLCDAISAEPW